MACRVPGERPYFMGLALFALTMIHSVQAGGGFEGLLHGVKRFFRGARQVCMVSHASVEMETYCDDPPARAERLFDSLEALCGPYRPYQQKGIYFSGDKLDRQEKDVDLKDVADRLTSWRYWVWGVSSDQDGDALSPECEHKMRTLWYALRNRNFDEVEAVWQILEEYERAMGQALIEDEIGRWKKLVRLGRLSRTGADNSHCFYIALGLYILPQDHSFMPVAETLQRLDGRSPWAIVNCACEPWHDADEKRFFAHSKNQLDRKACGVVVAKVAFDEDEVAKGSLCPAPSEDVLC